MSKPTMRLFTEQLRQGNTRIVAFVGGGISRASPASFPLSHEIVEAIMNSALEQTDLDSTLTERLKDSLKQTALPLEYFSQIAFQVFGREFVELFPRFVLPTARPNSFHRFLAVAASEGSLEAIITPNFDEFIEEAVKSLGMCQSQARRRASSGNNLATDMFPVGYYRVVSSFEDFASFKEFSDLNTTDKPGDTIPIIKLHGTLSTPESIAVSVESYQSWFLREKKSTVQSVLQRPRTWLFAGYSGRDEIFSWLHPPTTVLEREPLFQKVFWLMKKESPLLAPQVDAFLAKHSATIIVGTAEEFADEALASVGNVPQTESASLPSSGYAPLSSWFRQRARMKLYNFAAVLCLALGRYADAIETVRAGFRTVRNLSDDEKEISSKIRGLFYISIAKAELGDPEAAAADSERALRDWQGYKSETMAAGYSESEWRYIESRMKLWHGFALHLRNHNITDQLASWKLMTEAGEALQHWHDSQGLPRNFESSPEYAELHWRKGLFLLNGGDLELSRRCFWRMLDVDVFNDLFIERTRHLFGLALLQEAKARTARTMPYGDLIVRDGLNAALELAKAALDSVSSTYQVDLLAGILMLLARVSKELGHRKDAHAYYSWAADRLGSVHGDWQNSNEAQAKAAELSNKVGAVDEN